MEEYNPDVQYWKTTIVSDIILYTWESLDPVDRRYLLKKWADECLSTHINGIENIHHEEIRKAGQKLIKLRKDKEKQMLKDCEITNQPSIVLVSKLLYNAM